MSSKPTRSTKSVQGYLNYILGRSYLIEEKRERVNSASLRSNTTHLCHYHRRQLDYKYQSFSCLQEWWELFKQWQGSKFYLFLHHFVKYFKVKVVRGREGKRCVKRRKSERGNTKERKLLPVVTLSILLIWNNRKHCLQLSLVSQYNLTILFLSFWLTKAEQNWGYILNNYLSHVHIMLPYH